MTAANVQGVLTGVRKKHAKSGIEYLVCELDDHFEFSAFGELVGIIPLFAGKFILVDVLIEKNGKYTNYTAFHVIGGRSLDEG